jgi:hypothetical protein
MPEDNPLQTLHATVHCFLSMLQAAADAMAEACPPVGGPYRERLSRLRARLAFDSSASAIEESCAIASRGLKEYAGVASAFVERQRVEFRRATAGVEDIVRTIEHRQDFYSARLRQFAMQIENLPSTADAGNLAEAAALQAASLLSCVESMSHESQSLLRTRPHNGAWLGRMVPSSWPFGGPSRPCAGF